MKKLNQRYVVLLLTVFIISGFMFAKSSTVARAASQEEYVPLFGVGVVEGQEVNVKGYNFSSYFDYQTNKYVVQMEDKYGELVNIPVNRDGFTNGKYIYYVKNSRLYRYTIASGRNKRLKKLPKTVEGEKANFSISAIKGNNIYMTMGIWYIHRQDTYLYSLKTRKLSRVLKNCDINNVKSDYCVGLNNWRTDFESGYGITLYKFTENGLKKVRKLAGIKKGKNVKIIGNYVYYTYIAEADEIKLCKCRLDGRKRTVINTFPCVNNPSPISDISNKSCVISLLDGKYRYIYKTKQYILLEAYIY